MMPALFFVSGYLTPASMRDRGAGAFLASRFRRLMVPWLVAALTLIPLYRVIFLHTRDLPPGSWTAYFHFTGGDSSQNWLWFLPLLFLFNVAYVILARMAWLPDRLRFRHALAAACLVGLVTSLGMDLTGLRGWTHTALVDFQNERLLVYLLAFLLGSLASAQDIFATIPRSKTLFTVVSCTVWIPIMLYIVFLLVPYVAADGVLITSFVDRLILWLCFFLSLVCLVYVTTLSFWRHLDRPGMMWACLGRNSYYVYLVHVIVLGVIGTLLVNLALPSLAKYLILGATTYAVSNAVAWLIRLATGRRIQV